MKLQRLLSLLRQAVVQYNMIEDGDHIAIGISGGKDSLTLLYGLAISRNFIRNHFVFPLLPLTWALIPWIWSP